MKPTTMHTEQQCRDTLKILDYLRKSQCRQFTRMTTNFSSSLNAVSQTVASYTNATGCDETRSLIEKTARECVALSKANAELDVSMERVAECERIERETPRGPR